MNKMFGGTAIAAAMIVAACGGGGNSGSAGSGNAGAASPPATPANPAATQVLTVVRAGTGTVTSTPPGIACGSTCSGAFTTGASVSLEAVPGVGYTFSGWSGGDCSGTTACAVPMSQAQTVTANFAAAPVGSTAYIPLTLVAGPAAARVPVRSGMPFPAGAITDATRLRLETGAGAEVAAQFDVLARWPDDSIKVALVQAVVDLGAAASYRVAYGTGVSRAALPRNIKVTGTPTTELLIDTGAVQFAVNPKGLVKKVWRDTNANGTFTADEQVIDDGDMFVVNAKDNLEYTASAAADAAVTLEENGPVRVVVKATGTLTAAGGSHPVKYLLRYYASQGSDKIDIEATIIDDRMETNVEVVPAEFAFAAKGLGLRWRYVADGSASYRFGGEGGIAYSGTATGEHYLAQGGLFRYVNGVDQGHTFSYTGVGTGSKAPGWMAVDTGGKHIALMVKDFWQQYPNELNLQAGNRTITASLFPARSVGAAAQTSAPATSNANYVRANTLYFARPGGAKTYQLRLAVGGATPATDTLAALNDSFQRHRLDLVATPQWYTASKVFGDLDTGASAAGSIGYNAMLMQDIFERSIERLDGVEANATMYGWRDHGDRLRAGWNVLPDGVTRVPSFYNDTHVGANNFYTQFLRTGDARWFQLAEISTLHFRDIDVSHGPRKGYWNTGGQATPAGEIHALSHENIDHQVRNMHWGHAHVSGLSDSYLLTGDKRSHDVLAEIAGWWKFVSPHFFKRPFVFAQQYREAERDYGWPLYVMNEWVRVSGDATYHKDVAGGLVDYLGQWFRTPANHVGYNPATGTVSNAVLGQNNAAAGTGYWTMTKMDNHGGFDATGTNPWMAGAFLGNLIKFHEAEEQFTAAFKGSGLNRTQRVDMLLQGMNYVVKYGYVPAVGSAKPYFAYSEATRSYSGGDTHIIYPLAYLDRLFVQEKAAGRLANPGWYDTQPSWGAIASRRYDELNAEVVGTNTQSYGFYGYEMVYPADFFRVMRDKLGR